MVKESSLLEKIEWFDGWITRHSQKPSAMEAEDYADMFEVLEAARKWEKRNDTKNL